ncbi:helix-turn-helix transcriptional regulator [Streptomyces griseus]|uniref:helix-turn-helix transcriptional regulator n=1 Tax=Streptomyces griseus TaxID=1911 RepID=UPI0037B74A5F
MSGNRTFTPREAEMVTLLADGLTISEVDHHLGTTDGFRHLSTAKAKAGVTTVRALVYVSLAEDRIARPAPITTEQQPSEVEELIWAGLRFDIRDGLLSRALARLACTTDAKVRSVLADLRARYRTTHCGLIAQGFALGLLSGREGTSVPRGSAPVAAASDAPGPGPSRTGPWKLTGRQSQALSLLLASRNLSEAAGQMGVKTTTYRKHLKALSEAAGASCLRALTHRALQDGVLRPPPLTEQSLPDLTSDLAMVWRGLVLDVPDRDLQIEIAAANGLSGQSVQAALGELRASRGETDCQLVARGWACGVITAQTGAGRLTHAGPPATPPRQQLAAQSRPPHGPHRPADRLCLLPSAPLIHVPRRRKGAAASTAQEVHAGKDMDLVLVTADVCRQLLAGLPPAEWGPVVGRVEAGNALLLIPPARLPDGWRARYGRLWRRGAPVTLPPDVLPAADGAYWAVPRQAPRWDPDRLEHLLHHLPPALAAAPHG